jgi:hypothetical protein
MNKFQKERILKRLSILVILLLVLVLAVGTTACGGNDGGTGSGPESTVHNYLRAVEKGDAARMYDYCAERPSDEEIQGAQMMIDMLELDVKISNIKTEIITQSADRASVQAEYDSEITSFGETEREHSSEIIDLIKKDGKWYIADCGEDF